MTSESIPADYRQNVLTACEHAKATTMGERNNALIMGGLIAVAGANMIKFGFKKTGGAVLVASTLAATGLAGYANNEARIMHAIGEEIGSTQH